MFVKLVVVACCVAASLAAWHGPLAGGEPAARYPAGVDPHACPNYPHCDNPAVAAGSSHGAYNSYNGGHAGAWNGGDNGQWNGGHNGAYNNYNGAHDNGQWNGDNGAHNGAYNGAYSGHQNALDVGGYTGDGDYHGEGLAESGAFGDVSQGHHGGYAGDHQAYNHAGGYNNYAPQHGHAAQVPAGVDPHSCPNYPYCH